MQREANSRIRGVLNQVRVQVGLLYSDAGQFAKAGPYFSQALAMLEGELGPSHLHLANVCNGEA